jgi:hypothetical protein
MKRGALCFPLLVFFHYFVILVCIFFAHNARKAKKLSEKFE